MCINILQSNSYTFIVLSIHRLYSLNVKYIYTVLPGLINSAKQVATLEVLSCCPFTGALHSLCSDTLGAHCPLAGLQ